MARLYRTVSVTEASKVNFIIQSIFLRFLISEIGKSSLGYFESDLTVNQYNKSPDDNFKPFDTYATWVLMHCDEENTKYDVVNIYKSQFTEYIFLSVRIYLSLFFLTVKGNGVALKTTRIQSRSNGCLASVWDISFGFSA